MPDIRVIVDDAQAQRALEILLKRTSPASLRIFLRTKVRPYLVTRIERRFRQEGDSAVGAWEELTFATGLIRQWQGYPPFHPINKRSGALERHLTSSFRVSAAGNSGARLTIPASSGGREMKSKLATAQGGGAAPTRQHGPSRMAPARAVLALDNVDERAISDSLLHWIQTGGGVV